MILIQLFVAIYLRFYPGIPFDRSFGLVEKLGLGRDLNARAWKRFEEKLSGLLANEIAPVLDELCHTEQYDDAIRQYLRESQTEVANLVAGSYHIFLAWESRSAAWAHELTESQIAGFFEHLERSQDFLTQTYKNPKLALEARSQLITVAMGLSDKEYASNLYQQCMEIDPKHLAAKLSYFKVISTRWLSRGDSEPMRKFCMEEDHGEMTRLMKLVYWLETYRDYFYWYREEGIDEYEAQEKFKKEHKVAYTKTLNGIDVPKDHGMISIYTQNYLACLLTIIDRDKPRNRILKLIGKKYDYWSWGLAGIESERRLKWYKFAKML